MLGISVDEKAQKSVTFVRSVSINNKKTRGYHDGYHFDGEEQKKKLVPSGD